MAGSGWMWAIQTRDNWRSLLQLLTSSSAVNGDRRIKGMILHQAVWVTLSNLSGLMKFNISGVITFVLIVGFIAQMVVQLIK